MEVKEREFKNNLFKHSEKELVERLKSFRSISETESVKAEMIRRLIMVIKEFNENSSKYSKVIIALTIVLGILALIQIGLMFFRLI